MKKSWITEIIAYQYQKGIELKLRKLFDGRFVAMFHQIEDDKNKWYDDRYAISFVGFCEFVKRLQSAGYAIVPPYEILNKDERKKVVLTFDDVFGGVYRYVYPFLKERKIPFVVFPAIDKMNEQGFVDKEMIIEMRKYAGCYVGAHSITHRKLSELTKEECWKEINKSGNMLEEILDCPVDIFAYPYGSLSAVGRRERKMAKERYKISYGTLQGGVTAKVNSAYIPRLNINEANYVNRII